MIAWKQEIEFGRHFGTDFEPPDFVRIAEGSAATRSGWKGQPAAACPAAGVRGDGHDLRHAHASWLLAGGADLQVVKERIGHGSIATMEKYLHTLPNADETALDALARIRGGH